MKRLSIEPGSDSRLALKVLMMASGVDGVTLAKKTGIKQPTLARKLRGEYDFKLSEVKAIAKALELTPEDAARIFFEIE